MAQTKKKAVIKDHTPYEFKKDSDESVIGDLGQKIIDSRYISKKSNMIYPPSNPSKTFKTVFTIIQWLVVIAILYAVFFGFKIQTAFQFGNMTGAEVLFFGLSLAFLWVEKWKIGVIKPFSCLGCMAGWFCIALAGFGHTPHWYLYGPAGVFIGSLFGLIKGKL